MSFSPVYTADSRVLILGTWPSPKSRAQGFYYGHPQNRFWPLLAALLNEEAPCELSAKKALIERHSLALWDTVASCTITGARDATIRDVVPNDIAALCRLAPIQRVLCNGAVSYRLYQRYQTGGVPALLMPSTSPANAAWGMERLKGTWGAALQREGIH